MRCLFLLRPTESAIIIIYKGWFLVMKKWLVLEGILFTALAIAHLLNYPVVIEWLEGPVLLIFIVILLAIMFGKSNHYTDYFRYSIQFSSVDSFIDPTNFTDQPKEIKLLKINKETNEWLILSKLSQEDVQTSLNTYLNKHQITTKTEPKIALIPYTMGVFPLFR